MTNPSNRDLLISLVLFLMLAFVAKAQRADKEEVRCATVQRDSIKALKDPALVIRKQKSEDAIQNYIKMNGARMRISADELITIPVVVHVIHDQKDNNIGGANNTNISDTQIQSQIDVLNEDYSNQSGYKGYYTDSLGVDTGIRFRLISVVRTYSEKSQFSPITDDLSLATISPPWLTNRYLNIWVCRLSNRYLGASQFPTVNEINNLTAGLSKSDEDENYTLTDGVIIDSRYFGRNSPVITSSLYNLGRTTTHEVGHWLGLIHTWGDTRCGTDHCDDTPREEEANQTTDLTCSVKFSDCGGISSRDMIENYMDYSPDQCMSIFTNDQKNRMYAVLALSPRRMKLVEYSKRTDTSVTIEVYPNPVSEFLYANIYTPDYQTYSVSVFNNRGMRMTDEIPNRTYIDVKTYPAGIYYLRVNTNNKIVTKRFFVR